MIRVDEACVLNPDGNNVEALYPDVGNVGHHASPKLGRHSRTLAHPGQSKAS